MKRHLFLVTLLIAVVLLPKASLAGMHMTLDEAFSGLSSNEMGDIRVMYLPGGDTIIWVGTGRGISKTTDRGESWYFYNERNGLNKDEVSAMDVHGTTLWAATAYNRESNGVLYPCGRGVNKTDDLGDTWESYVPFQLSKYVGMVSYDLVVDDTTVWAAAWYGGLIRSQDGGQTWENVFVDSAAQEDFEEEYFDDYRNYFFAVVVDTVCPLKRKLENSINDIHYDGQLLWVATQTKLNGSLDLGDTWFPKDTSHGLNSNTVYCLAGDVQSFWAGLYEPEETLPLPLLPSLTGSGFNFSSDYGTTWDSAYPDLGQASSTDKFPLNIAVVDTVVWAACKSGGLIRSFDRGETWQNIFADSSARRRFDEGSLEPNDQFTAVAVDTFAQDTTVVWGGTRNGLYKFVYTDADSADTVIRYLYHDEQTGGSGWAQVDTPITVLSLGIQRYQERTEVWVGGYRYPGSDTYPSPGLEEPLTLKSTDGGESWSAYLEDILPRDFAFLDSAVWVATHEGLKRSTDGGENWDSFEVVDSTSGDVMIPSQFTSVCVVDDATGPIVFVGSIDGLAKSTDDGITWEVTRFDDSFNKAVWAGSAAGIFKFTYNYRNAHDAAVQYTYGQHGITGNWVVALAIQEYQGKKVIWAGTQPVNDGNNGASFSEDDGDTWQTTLVGDRVWNFDFDDTVVWAATSSGLKRTSDWGQTWEVFNYMQDDEDKILSTEFTSVTVIDGEIWAGNLDGLVRTRTDGDSWDVYRTADSIGSEQTTYAYPSPFSPILQGGGYTRIRYRPLQSGSVTIKIYDFSMDLVITLVDGEYRYGGMEYDEPWDGRNGEGDLVANGVYFIRFEAPGGQKEWGKVVVLK